MLLTLFALTACTDDESDLGSTLMDADALYNAKNYTMTVDTAYSLRDDSLLTTGNTEIMIGNYHDAIFGKVTAQYFTQITLPNATTSVAFEDVTIDSVVMTLVYDSVFPDTTRSYNLHFEVVQLAEAIASDKQYYAMDSIDVNTDAVLFNGTVQTKPGSGTVSMHLGGPINSMLQMTANRDAFAEATKGLRISVLPTGSDEGMVAMNLSDTRTLIRVHYHYDTTSYHFDLSISNGKHFTHFVHDYSGTVLDGVRSLDGASRLYLDPLGGFKAVVSFDRTLRAFREAHPRAVVHKADLLIPVAAEADAKKPHRLIATNGTRYINDYISAGVDGYYHSDSIRYRIRVAHTCSSTPAAAWPTAPCSTDITKQTRLKSTSYTPNNDEENHPHTCSLHSHGLDGRRADHVPQELQRHHPALGRGPHSRKRQAQRQLDLVVPLGQSVAERHLHQRQEERCVDCLL